jgi:hypothetical protein
MAMGGSCFPPIGFLYARSKNNRETEKVRFVHYQKPHTQIRRVGHPEPDQNQKLSGIYVWVVASDGGASVERFRRNLRQIFRASHKSGRIKISQGMMATTVMITAAVLSAKTWPDWRKALPI